MAGLCPTWSGYAFIQHSPVTADSLSLCSDASGIGFGAYFDTHWFAILSHSNTGDTESGFNKLFAITAAIFTWGNDLSGKKFYSLPKTSHSFIHSYLSFIKTEFTSYKNYKILCTRAPPRTRI